MPADLFDVLDNIKMNNYRNVCHNLLATDTKHTVYLSRL